VTAVRIAFSKWDGSPHWEYDAGAERFHLVARVAGEMRTYRVSRLLAVDALDDGFERAACSDLAGHCEAGRRVSAVRAQPRRQPR
jgi:hypothetical protein